MKPVVFTHHARRQWANRFDDIGDAIEDEFAQAKPASPKVRRKLFQMTHDVIRRVRGQGDRPLFYVSRRCIFPIIKKPCGKMIVTTVYYRRKTV